MRKKAGARAWQPGLAWKVKWTGIEVGLGAEFEIRSNQPPRFCFICLGASLDVPTPLGESANDELLSKAGADPLCCADCEIPKDKANATIRSGKIEIRDAG